MKQIPPWEDLSENIINLRDLLKNFLTYVCVCVCVCVCEVGGGEFLGTFFRHTRYSN